MSIASITVSRVGKASFDVLYDRLHPKRYFTALRPLEYRIPDYAQPVILECITALGRLRRKTKIKVLDLCCGYGINGALLKHDVFLEDLYDLYDQSLPDGTVEKRIAKDRAYFDCRRRNDLSVEVIGQDIAINALRYATEVGAIDTALRANLERRTLRPHEVKLIADVDLITVTGGLSYIGPVTFENILTEVGGQPWVLYFPLRHMSIHDVRATLEQFGLITESWFWPLKQRRFKDDRERQSLLSRYRAWEAQALAEPSRSYVESFLCLARSKQDRDAIRMRDLLDMSFETGRDDRDGERLSFQRAL